MIPSRVIRNIQNFWEGQNDRLKLSFKCFGVFLYFLTGILFYQSNEGWNIVTSLFFTVVTISTVGYGYHYPTNDRSRIFTIFYMGIGVYGIFASLKQTIADRFLNPKTDNIRHKIKSTDQRKKMLLCIVAIITCLVFGALVFMAQEGWSFITAFYFALETTSTVGYGDLNIKHDSTYVFLLFYITISIILVGYCIACFSALLEEQRSNRKFDEIQRKRLDMISLVNLNEGKGGVNKHQFALAVLEHIGTINNEIDIKPWFEKFEELDRNKCGVLDREDLERFSFAEAKSVENENLLHDNYIKNSNSGNINLPSSLLIHTFSQQRSPLKNGNYDNNMDSRLIEEHGEDTML
eukprot:gene9260-12475_t